MVRFPTLLSAGLVSVCLATLSPTLSQAASPGCALEGVKLDCSQGGKKRKWSQITGAFASDETRKLLADPHEHLGLFTHPLMREDFRKSIEAAWQIVNQYDRYSQRLLKQGRISDEEYRARVAVHRQAEKSYEAAYWFYKNINWLQQ